MLIILSTVESHSQCQRMVFIELQPEASVCFFNFLMSAWPLNVQKFWTWKLCKKYFRKLAWILWIFRNVCKWRHLELENLWKQSKYLKITAYTKEYSSSMGYCRERVWSIVYLENGVCKGSNFLLCKLHPILPHASWNMYQIITIASIRTKII